MLKLFNFTCIYSYPKFNYLLYAEKNRDLVLVLLLATKIEKKNVTVLKKETVIGTLDLLFATPQQSLKSLNQQLVPIQFWNPLQHPLPVALEV